MMKLKSSRLVGGVTAVWCVGLGGMDVFGQSPVMSVQIGASSGPDPTCFAPNETVSASVVVDPGATGIIGGQFLLTFASDCLDFVSLSAGVNCDPASPFDQIVNQVIDQTGGTIFAAAAAPQGSGGAVSPAALACLTFQRAAHCPPCAICFDSQNPGETVLTDVNGDPVNPQFSGNGCSAPIREVGVPTLSCPGNVVTNAACDASGATVVWDSPSALDSCEGPLSLNCMGWNSEGENVTELVLNGGMIPVGVSTFSCAAMNGCGEVDECEWLVTVDSLTSLEVTVQLSPAIVPEVIHRCVEFLLYTDCANPPEVVHEVLTFGAPGYPAGWAVDSIKVPQQPYTCIRARDPLHTVGSSVLPQCLPDGRLTASFTGDPESGGNWLIGGNLNQSPIIDILDFGVLVSKYLTQTNPDTTCDQATNPQARHADVNGDGVVDLTELTFIMINFLANDKSGCCEEGGGTKAMTSVSVGELIAMGEEGLTIADLNQDGWVNAVDVQLLLSGQYTPPNPTPLHSRSNVGLADDD